MDDHTLGIVMTGVHSLASTNHKQNILSNIKKREWREERRGKRRRENGRQGEEKRRGKKERRKE